MSRTAARSAPVNVRNPVAPTPDAGAASTKLKVSETGVPRLLPAFQRKASPAAIACVAMPAWVMKSESSRFFHSPSI